MLPITLELSINIVQLCFAYVHVYDVHHVYVCCCINMRNSYQHCSAILPPGLPAPYVGWPGAACPAGPVWRCNHIYCSTSLEICPCFICSWLFCQAFEATVVAYSIFKKSHEELLLTLHPFFLLSLHFKYMFYCWPSCSVLQNM